MHIPTIRTNKQVAENNLRIRDLLVQGFLDKLILLSIGGLFTMCARRVLSRWRETVHGFANLVGMLLQCQRLGADLRQSLWAKLHDIDQFQGLFDFFSLPPPDDS